MKPVNVLGYVLLSLPFIGMFTFMVKESGWLPAFGVFGLSAALIGLVAFAVQLTNM